MPDSHELVYHDALGYSVDESPVNRIVYIAPYSTHVNVGFVFGGGLHDPKQLLEGNGKRMRHIKIRTSRTAIRRIYVFS